MRVKFNSDLEPSYLLNKEETRKLREDGHIYDEELEVGIIITGEKFVLLKPVPFFESITFNCEEHDYEG